VMASLLVMLNYRGVKETGSFQNYIVISLVGLILVFIIVGLLSINPDNLTPFTGDEGWAAVGVTAGTVFVTFIGFEVIATSAEEIKEPGRNLPLSMVAAVVTPTLLYVLVMLVSLASCQLKHWRILTCRLRMLPAKQQASSETLASLDSAYLLGLSASES